MTAFSLCRPAACPSGVKPVDCTFTAPRVRWYLVCWRLAQMVREPFSDVLRAESRNSRDIDPWIRGGRVDPEVGRLIGLSLESARDKHGIALVVQNADRIAAVLCDHGEGTRER